MTGDLHTHSLFSDGSVEIEKLSKIASWAGLSHLAVTDHDTFRAWDYAMEHPVCDGVELIPGMEISSWDPVRGRKVHLLCYWPDKTPGLENHVAQMRRSRNRQQQESIEKLLKIYSFLTKEEIEACGARSEMLYKAHIMRILRDYGLTDKIYGDLYHKLLCRGGPCFAEPSYRCYVEESLALAKQARAVVILAHPGVYDSMDLAEELAAQGKIDGVEIDHPGNSEQVRERLKDLAKRYDLIVTGGTDYHGQHSDKVAPIGSCCTEDAQLRRLIALRDERKKL